jgi:hypothetical protein
VLTRLSAAGAIYLVIVCLCLKSCARSWAHSFYFGGHVAADRLVVVVMDFIAQIQAHLMSHQYESLLKKRRTSRVRVAASAAALRQGGSGLAGTDWRIGTSPSATSPGIDPGIQMGDSGGVSRTSGFRAFRAPE